MCKYCKDAIQKNESITAKPLITNTIRLGIAGMLIQMLSIDDRSRLHLCTTSFESGEINENWKTIKYCPMCGRKL